METENQDIQKIAASEFLEWVTIKYQFVPQVVAQLPSVEELERELGKNDLTVLHLNRLLKDLLKVRCLQKKFGKKQVKIL